MLKILEGENVMEPSRKLYILLTRFPGKTAIAIHAMTGCYYTHASIGLEEDMNTFYSVVGKGLIVEKITRYVRPDRDPFPCQLYELEVSEKVYQTVKLLLEESVQNKSRYHYSKLGVVLCLLRIPFKRRYHYFCSQFVAETLMIAQAARLKKDSTLYYPGDFQRMPGMRLHYQGDLRSFLGHFALAPAA